MLSQSDELPHRHSNFSGNETAKLIPKNLKWEIDAISRDY
jgi:hypothetical protein